MPMYAYKCESCKSTFEVKQRMLDEPLAECILCNDSQVRRVINNVGIVFKGNGFYVTDTRQAKNGALKSESKPDTKVEKASSAKDKQSAKSEPAKEKSTKPAASAA